MRIDKGEEGAVQTDWLNVGIGNVEDIINVTSVRFTRGIL